MSDVRDLTSTLFIKITLVWASHLDHDVRDVITLGDEDVHGYELRRDRGQQIDRREVMHDRTLY